MFYVTSDNNSSLSSAQQRRHLHSSERFRDTCSRVFSKLTGLLDTGRTSAELKDVNFAFHSPHRQKTFGLEEGRAERPGGEMVRKSGEKPGEEAEEDGTTG